MKEEEKGTGDNQTDRQRRRETDRRRDSLGRRQGGSALSGGLRELLIHKADLVVIHKTDLAVDPCLSPPTCAEKSDKEADLWLFAPRRMLPYVFFPTITFYYFQTFFAPEWHTHHATLTDIFHL